MDAQTQAVIDEVQELTTEQLLEQSFDFGEDFDPYAESRINPDAEQAGVWVEINSITRAKVRRVGPMNEDYLRAQEAALRAVRVKPDDAATKRIHAKLFASHAVTAWETKDKNGKWHPVVMNYLTKKPEKYSVAAVEAVLIADEAIFTHLANASISPNRYLAAVTETDVGN